MDNQGSNNFNNGQGITPQDTNFWNPISPQGQPAPQATQASQIPQPTQPSQAFGFASAPATSAASVTPSALILRVLINLHLLIPQLILQFHLSPPLCLKLHPHLLQ